MKLSLSILLLVVGVLGINAQAKYELDDGWKCMPISKVKAKGEKISVTSYDISKWSSAVVPGTVLTTMLHNKQIPDPFYGMNNEKIPDIYNVGRDYYTYWFVKNFKEKQPKSNDRIWLDFRGINYSCEIYLNGKHVNKEPYQGMFMRKSYDITSLIAKSGENRLAVVVYPPNPVGKPNGGQGGDGLIAKNLCIQYTPGWDWIQPIRDRNTGIWDKVYIKHTGAVRLRYPHVITLVAGKRDPDAKMQNDATLKLSTVLQNASNHDMSGILSYTFDGKTVSKNVKVEANSSQEFKFDDYLIKNPKLWWPAGYGRQYLYDLHLSFKPDNTRLISDTTNLKIGVRQIQASWNKHTKSCQISVNGQKIFIKGGDWVISDAMLRFTKERYDAEVRYHRDMNLNLIRIWGGALTERPEFYEACDKYGILVFQDFWFSGDCDGRWLDPCKAEDQWTRRKYPDDHNLVINSAADMIKMIRNHPSLTIWCGGNEIAPPQDILQCLRDSLLTKLDGTRPFFEFSNTCNMSYNNVGGNGDGPYGIQPISSFWEIQTFPFNSEVGSVGVGDYESLERFIPKNHLIPPVYVEKAGEKPYEKIDSVWKYHTYTGVGYANFIKPYGNVKDIKDFALKAQLVNYDQYRALMEGFSSHMWDWYTGSIIWKTQNPWTATRGQMYDCYLDPNACLFGLRNGSEKLHGMCNPVTGMLYIVNNGFKTLNDIMIAAKLYDMKGNSKIALQSFCNIGPSLAQKILCIKPMLDTLCQAKGGFLSVDLLDINKNVLSRNLYWYPDAKGQYSGLQEMKMLSVNMKAKQIAPGRISIQIDNAEHNPIAFFSRISLLNAKTKKRVLPAFYNDNYISVLPGESRTVIVDYDKSDKSSHSVTIRGWNVLEQEILVK